MQQPYHVLFISYDGMTDPLGQSQVIPYLAGLKKYGYNITILSCEKKEVYPQKKGQLAAILSEHGINWVPLLYTKKPPVLSTLADVIKLKRAAAKIHSANTVHMVHTRPGIPSLVGLWFKKKYKARFLNDIREFYADSRVDGGMWNKNVFLYRKIYYYFKKQEAEQVKYSDGIVCLTYAAQKIIENWPEYNKNIPLEVIPCSVDTVLFDPAAIHETDRQALRRQLNIPPGNILFTYLGSIGGWYLTDEMMRLCKIIADKIPQSSFLFISPHLHTVITAAAAKQGLTAGRIITRQAGRKEIPLLLSLSNYSLFFIKPCYSKLSSSPTKHGELMAMGLPVITNNGVGDVEEIVTKYNAGIVLDDFSDETFQSVANTIAAGISFNPGDIRKGAIEFYDLDTAIKKYARIYKSILP